MILNENYDPHTLATLLREWRDESATLVQRIDTLAEDVEHPTVSGDNTAARLTALALRAERIAEVLRSLQSHALFVPGDVPPAPITGVVSVQELGGDWRAKTHLHLVQEDPDND